MYSLPTVLEKELASLPVAPSIAVSLWVVSIWLVLIDLLQFVFTEIWYVTNRIPELLVLGLLVAGILVASVLQTYATPPKWFASVPVYTLTLCSFCFLVVSHWYYKEYYNSLQQYPKIKEISKNWTIPGDRIEIIGRNFGEPHEPGKVMVGDVEFMNITWTDTRVVVEQPVAESHVGELEVCSVSNCAEGQVVHFELRNSL